MTDIAAHFSGHVLMRPEDFLKRRDGTDFSLAVHKHPDNKCQSMDTAASSAKYHMSHSHKETARHIDSFSQDIQGIMGQSVCKSRAVLHNIEVQNNVQVKALDHDCDTSPPNPAHGQATDNFAIPTKLLPADELRQIRDKLQYFKSQKKRLR